MVGTLSLCPPYEIAALLRTKFVGWVKARTRRAHHLSPIRFENGCTLSLCPPYEIATP